MLFRRSSPVQDAIAQAVRGRSATTPLLHVTRNVFWDDVPDTYRFHRRTDNGWVRLLTANLITKEVYEVQAKEPGDVELIREALQVMGIPGTVNWQNDQVIYSNQGEPGRSAVPEERTCPFCDGKLFMAWDRCPWCNADITTPPVLVNAGDVITVKNPFKGNHVEQVTVVRVLHDGWALEVRDSRGLVWGYLKPRDIVSAAGAKPRAKGA